METRLRNTVKKLKNGFKKISASIQDQLGVVKNALANVGEKVKKVDSDFQVLGRDFESKYNPFIHFLLTFVVLFLLNFVLLLSFE